MAKIKINGREWEVPKGANLLQICLDNGIFVPHYCYHPGLTPAGNCRMCLVKLSTSRKLEVACMTSCTDGMEVTTEAPEVSKARQDVLEFLLVNHPLDCPICDKAGECALQDFTYTYRGGLSRMEDPKVFKHTKDLGPDIRFWGNRCIVCTRCVRFCDEIAGTGELAVVNRGDHSTIDVYPGRPIENPLSLNVVDICPVGALIDKNFLYQARVWYTQEPKSLCPSCSRGCNIKVTALEGQVKRLVPRANPEVNQYWMCDEGRLNWRYVHSPRRLTQWRGTSSEIASGLRDAAQKYGVEAVAAVISSWHSVEELYLFKKLVEALRISKVAVLTQDRGERQTFKGGFTIEPDKTPNRAAAALFLDGAMGSLPSIQHGLAGGSLKALLLFNAIPEFRYPTEFVDAAKKAEFLAVGDILENPLTESAHVVAPGCAWVEKDGTFLNVQNRIQRFRRAIEPPGQARPEVEILQGILLALGARKTTLSAEGVFKEMAKEVSSFSGLDYARIGDLGIVLSSGP